MPEYEELVARALAAHEEACRLNRDAVRVRRLARILREAGSGSRMLVHCAWCGRLEVGDEWLRLDTIGSGQTRIAERIVRRSTHGICPDCFARVSRDAAAERASSG
ncbi:MAG TPA: hypothetical protein VE984_06790 [Gaiellaceae bacterium]|nr:hypothetical protein [Gaiellaceae bacterium]